MRPGLGNFTPRDFADFGESDFTKYFKGGGRGESLWGNPKSIDEVVLDFKKAGEEKEGNEESEEDEVGDQAEEVVGEIVESGRVNARAWEFHGGI